MSRTQGSNMSQPRQAGPGKRLGAVTPEQQAQEKHDAQTTQANKQASRQMMGAAHNALFGAQNPTPPPVAEQQPGKPEPIRPIVMGTPHHVPPGNTLAEQSPQQANPIPEPLPLHERLGRVAAPFPATPAGVETGLAGAVPHSAPLGAEAATEPLPYPNTDESTSNLSAHKKGSKKHG